MSTESYNQPLDFIRCRLFCRYLLWRRSKSSVCGQTRSSSGDSGRHELAEDDRVQSPGRKEADCKEMPKMRGVRWQHSVGFSASPVGWRESSQRVDPWGQASTHNSCSRGWPGRYETRRPRAVGRAWLSWDPGHWDSYGILCAQKIKPIAHTSAHTRVQ